MPKRRKLQIGPCVESTREPPSSRARLTPRARAALTILALRSDDVRSALDGAEPDGVTVAWDAEGLLAAEDVDDADAVLEIVSDVTGLPMDWMLFGNSVLAEGDGRLRKKDADGRRCGSLDFRIPEKTTRERRAGKRVTVIVSNGRPYQPDDHVKSLPGAVIHLAIDEMSEPLPCLRYVPMTLPHEPSAHEIAELHAILLAAETEAGS